MLVFAGMGFELVVLVTGSAYIGSLVDSHMDWSGIATTSLILIVLVGWLIHIVVLAQSIDKQESQRKKPKNP